MFNYLKSLILSTQANTRASRAIADSNRYVSEAIDSQTRASLDIAKEKLEVKNRVDISLRDYEKLKSRAEAAESEVVYLRRLLEKLNLPLDDVRFKPYDITIEWISNPLSFNKDCIVRFKIRSDADYGN